MKITRRELLHKVSAAGLVLAADPFFYACAQETRGPRAIALCIALNRVNPQHYGGWSGELGGCHADQEVMFRIAQSKGFTVRCLRDQHATRKNVRDSIAFAGEHLAAGDLLLVSTSGHGSHRVDNENETNEADRQDECWCLWDGLFFDDELLALWSQFRNTGVRVLVVSDTCHSGTIARVAPEALRRQRASAVAATTRDTTVAKVIPSLRTQFDVLIDHLENNKVPTGLSPIREMPEAIRRRILNNVESARFYQSISSQHGAKAQMRAASKAAVVSLGAARDDEYALDIGTNGLFTHTLNQIWTAGGFRDYGEFIQRISTRIAGRQTPQLDRFGPGSDQFVLQSPFAV